MPRASFPLKLTAVLAALAAAALLPGGTSLAPATARAAAPGHAAVTTAAFAGLRTAQAGRSGQGATAGPGVTSAPADGNGINANPGTHHADLTAATTGSGGLCSVPGIGDIGGLLGFCAMGSSGLVGDLNNVCQPSLPEPEPASSGIDAMVAPPASGKRAVTLYDQYGVAGNNWAAINLQCSDMTSLIGNNVAGMVFDAAKSIDRVTITVYQAAAGSGIVSWLQRVTDDLITSLGRAIYFPYLSVVVILAAIWLAWQGLIRKRATRTIEGTVWMIAACAAAIFLIGVPGEVTGLGSGISDGISQALDTAFAKLPSPGPSSCVPVGKSDPQVQPAVYSYTSGSTVVDQNADELWSVLVCKPWLVGEFGTSVYTTGGAKPTVVNTYGRSLLWAQAIAADEHPTPALIQAKQAAYSGIASSLQADDPAIYPLFQGKDWTTRLEVAFAALFAALVAGVLILLISVTLILLKLSFLLLLIVGPFFLLIGAHPGFGRVVALRWVELVIGVLLKQAAVALVLSLLLYCYALIMGTSDAVLPWALKILMIALVTVAAFVYRKPFQHLFSAVGYGVIGSQERADGDFARAAAAARANTVTAATAALPGIAAYRAMRWARRNPGQAASVAMAAASGGATGAVAAGLQASGAAEGSDAPEGAAPTADASGVRAAVASRVRAGAATPVPPAPEPPPLKLPSRTGGPAPASLGSGRPTAAAGTVTRAAAGAWPGRPAGDSAAATGRATCRRTAPAAAESVSERPAGPERSAAAAVGIRAPAAGAWPTTAAADRSQPVGLGHDRGRAGSAGRDGQSAGHVAGPADERPARAAGGPASAPGAVLAAAGTPEVAPDERKPGCAACCFRPHRLRVRRPGRLPAGPGNPPRRRGWPGAVRCPIAPAVGPGRRIRATGSSSGPLDIYQWLPFTQSELAAAAATVVRFGDAYGTYSYTQNGAAYAASLQPVASAQLVGQIGVAYSAPGVAATRQSEQQVAVGTATISSLRAFGPGSLTFVVQVAQQLTDSSGRSELTTDYAVTVSGAGATWQVTDVELAAAGNS